MTENSRSKTLEWAAPGDINAFFGLMLDNIAQLLLTVSLLSSVFGFPAKFALRYLVPGTAIGVLVGDFLFFCQALRLSRRTLRQNVTAMPLGLDTPSTLGTVLLVVGPAFLQAKEMLGDPELAARQAWHIGIVALLVSGMFKLICAPLANHVRRVIPRAGLLGSLAAIALVLISFIPLLELLHQPLIGWTALAIILATLVARLELPLKIPGALGALLVAGSLYYVLKWAGFDWQETAEGIDPATGLWPYEWLEVWRFPWLSAIPATMPYLPIVIPFALATVVGGIDCAESAAAVGDEYDTRAVVGVEAIASIVAALCGGIVQTTPYIGHPAYKAMGGRSAYTLATALFVGAAGLIGFFGYLYVVIPKATVLPILVFVGLEITAQSFHATPVRHFPAVALACVPALATLVQIYVEKLTGVFVAPGTVAKFPPALAAELQTIRLLANGFVITSLCWASLLAALIDRQLRRASACAALAAVATLFGIMHSPLPGNPLVWPGSLPPDAAAATWSLALSYAVVAVLFLVGSVITKQVPRPE